MDLLFCGLCPDSYTIERWLRQRRERRAAEHEAENRALITRLEKDGHRCVLVFQSLPSHVTWCNQTPCVEAPDADDDFDIALHPARATKSERKTQRQLTKQLADIRSSGHTCIREYSAYPIHFYWCQKSPCTGPETASPSGELR